VVRARSARALSPVRHPRSGSQEFPSSATTSNRRELWGAWPTENAKETPPLGVRGTAVSAEVWVFKGGSVSVRFGPVMRHETC